MPELAEVETLARQLSQAASGARITGVEVWHPGWITAGDPAILEGLELQSVDRWGKRLRFLFEDGSVLVSGLGMTGNWLLERPKRHLVAAMYTSGGDVFYTDPRRFGHAQVFGSLEEAQEALGDRIGVDAASLLSDREMMDALRTSKMKLKAALLDQSRLSGIGNYLADEICFQACLLPDRPLDSLDESEIAKLNVARLEVIERALQNQGASFSDYRHADGSLGSMQEQMMVYGRDGQPCRDCGFEVVKTTLAGRGTHFCPVCQD